MADTNWTLHPRLQQDSLLITELATCTVRLLDDRRFPWLLLIPRVVGASSWFDLDQQTQRDVTAELDAVGRILTERFQPDRLNVGMIGNIVEQLHIHCVVRRETDSAWPGVVWGHGRPEPYDRSDAAGLCREIASGLRDETAPD